MAKYLVETYYTCTFKVNHYLDDINETELKNLEKRDDGKFEVLDVNLDNRKTKSLDPKNNKIIEDKNGLRKIVGDVDYKNVLKKVSYISPVPGGVGPMTIHCLLSNTFLLTKSRRPYKTK